MGRFASPVRLCVQPLYIYNLKYARIRPEPWVLQCNPLQDRAKLGKHQVELCPVYENRVFTDEILW